MSRLADWLVRQAPGYRKRHGARLTPERTRALAAIERCRTPAQGGQVYRCAECGGTHFGYHSCHHRACPRCGGAETAAWTARQEERLLPVPYFLVTFTLPGPVQALASTDSALLYELLFTESAATLQEVAANSRVLGAELGMLGVLHTSGRQLQRHPHLHYIVPGGGLRPDHHRWRKLRQPDWLLPVDLLSAVFASRMEEALRAAAPALHAQIPDSCWRGTWVVHSQPAGSGAAVVRYLARYVFRTAISDQRIVQLDDHRVVFHYIDSATKQRRTCRLDADEFLRRYLQHVPPEGFHRVRYFGWMHPAAKRRRAIVETLVAAVILVRAKPENPPQWHLRCPHCHAFALIAIERIKPQARAPP
jgi:hypothetical protein